MSVDMHELIAFRDKMDKMTKDFDKFLKKFLIRQALDVLAKTKMNTPTDTALLKNSWTIGNQTNTIGSRVLQDGSIQYFEVDVSKATLDSVTRVGDDLVITISNVVPYASYVEYGHSQQVGRYVPKLGKRLVSPWVDGKFMCTLALLDVKAKIPKRFESSFMRWWIKGMKNN